MKGRVLVSWKDHEVIDAVEKLDLTLGDCSFVPYPVNEVQMIPLGRPFHCQRFALSGQERICIDAKVSHDGCMSLGIRAYANHIARVFCQSLRLNQPSLNCLAPCRIVWTRVDICVVHCCPSRRAHPASFLVAQVPAAVEVGLCFAVFRNGDRSGSYHQCRWMQRTGGIRRHRQWLGSVSDFPTLSEIFSLISLGFTFRSLYRSSIRMSDPIPSSRRIRRHQGCCSFVASVASISSIADAPNDH